MNTLARTLALVTASSLCGCSLVFDFAPLGEGDSGPADGSVFPDGNVGDGSVDPNGPSAPVVVIEPATPTTSDELRAVITNPSVDPLDESITYEYGWTVDGAPGPTGETVAASETARGQVWQVTATPVAGGRRGEAGTASVTIANAPPVVVTVGLSTYQPFADERIEALPYAEDSDDDPIAYRLSGASMESSSRG